jgi:sugar phosphate isomerase/epimerase
MQLQRGAHLAYCTNIHPGEDWAQTFAALKNYTLAVRDRVSRNEPFAIGLRLSDQASRELINPDTLRDFRRWLDAESCYVFTINGFPFGRFHGGRVKEQVFAPDWSSPKRLAFTNRLFDILATLLPDGMEGSVSTLPGSFKGFERDASQLEAIDENFWRCIEHIAELSERTGHTLHLGVEPEPFGLFENTEETLAFFARMAALKPGDSRLGLYLGVNYDACHFAIQFEDAKESLAAFRDHGIRISKIHLSSALRAAPNENSLATLQGFAEDIYLHQVVARRSDGRLLRYQDLPVALEKNEPAAEWRIHFHVPLYAPLVAGLETTIDHALGVLDWLVANPGACHHLEMETYTWAVLPPELKSASVVDQLAREYEWILPQLASRALL